jgi:hypothetical protein
MFEGIFEDGFASTIGRLVPSDQSYTYLGGVEDLKKHGVGVLIEKGGRRYEGQFEDDVATGNGRIIFPNSDVYIGGIQKMQRQGAGAMEYADGKRFEGQFEKD